MSSITYGMHAAYWQCLRIGTLHAHTADALDEKWEVIHSVPYPFALHARRVNAAHTVSSLCSCMQACVLGWRSRRRAHAANQGQSNTHRHEQCSTGSPPKSSTAFLPGQWKQSRDAILAWRIANSFQNRLPACQQHHC